MIRGFLAEERFSRIASSLGWHVKPAQTKENRKHIDYYINDGKQEIKVEVKSAKRLSRADESVNYDWIWLEIQGVTGYRGWLFGKADWIAFEIKEGFVIAERSELIKLYREKVNSMAWVNDPHEAMYKCYRRPSRLDVVTLVATEDVRACAIGLWC